MTKATNKIYKYEILVLDHGAVLNVIELVPQEDGTTADLTKLNHAYSTLAEAIAQLKLIDEAHTAQRNLRSVEMPR